MFLNIRNIFDPQMLLGVVLYMKNDFFFLKKFKTEFLTLYQAFEKTDHPIIG